MLSIGGKGGGYHIRYISKTLRNHQILTVKRKSKHVSVNLSTVNVTFDTFFTVTAVHNESTVVMSDSHYTS